MSVETDVKSPPIPNEELRHVTREVGQPYKYWVQSAELIRPGNENDHRLILYWGADIEPAPLPMDAVFCLYKNEYFPDDPLLASEIRERLDGRDLLANKDAWFTSQRWEEGFHYALVGKFAGPGGKTEIRYLIKGISKK